MTGPCGGVSHARMGGGRRPPRCRGGGPFCRAPSIGVFGVVSLRARSIFSSSFVVGWLFSPPRGVLVSVVGRPVCKPPERGAQAPVCKGARGGHRQAWRWASGGACAMQGERLRGVSCSVRVRCTRGRAGAAL